MFPAGKTPEEVLKKYLQKVRHPPDEVRAAGAVRGLYGMPGGHFYVGRVWGHGHWLLALPRVGRLIQR